MLYSKTLVISENKTSPKNETINLQRKGEHPTPRSGLDTRAHIQIDRDASPPSNA